MRKRYGEYKKVDANWISEIPAHWSAKKVRALFKERREKVSDKEYQPLSVGKMGVVPQLDTACKTDNGDNRKLIRKGDFAINSRSDRKGSGGISEYDGSTSVITTVITPNSNLDGKFIHYLLRTNDFSEEYYRNGHGIVSDLWTTKYDEMRNIPLPVPPLSEQRAIVSYLDRKCGQIDALLKGYRRELGLLEELRVAEINRAVTKGLDPHAEMKDSGVSWIGEVPRGWEVVRFKYLMTDIVDCPHETPEYSINGKYFVIRTADQELACLRPDENMYRLNEDEYLNRIRRMPLNADDIVYGREGERWGYASLVKESNKYCLGQRMMQFRCNKSLIIPMFAVYALSSRYIHIQGEFDTFGSTSPHVNISTIRNYYIVYPPLSEQRAIVSYLDEKCGAIDRMKGLLERKIGLLEEYRVRLISDVVTGRVRV